MANVASGSAVQHFNEYRESIISITGIVYNPAGGSNYSFTPTIRSRALRDGSFVVSGTWATSTSCSVQLAGSNDNVSWVAIGVALSASSGTTPQGAVVSPDGFVFSFYQWQVTGGDAGTLLAIQARLMSPA